MVQNVKQVEGVHFQQQKKHGGTMLQTLWRGFCTQGNYTQLILR